MKHHVGLARRWATSLLGAAALALCMSAMAEYTVNLADGVDATAGGDMRIRLEGYDRSVVSPEMTVGGVPQEFGPPVGYLRVRTRVWAGLKFEDWMKLNVRLVNRVQDYSSRPGENSDGKNTWEFPDETIFDQLNLQLLNLGDSDWSLTIGRQDFPLGNQQDMPNVGPMVFFEGTPYDQGRTIYFDGISAVMDKEKDILKLFAFHNNYKDNTLVINDQNRRLSRGDISTTGASWTHKFRPSLNTDLYYIYANVNDTESRSDQSEKIERNFPGPDSDAVLHTAGMRLFGVAQEQTETTMGVNYSLEVAKQFGEEDRGSCGSSWYPDSKSSGGTCESDMTGWMADGRLMIKAKKDTLFSPSVLLQYTYFSGDDPGSGDEFEGWDPLFASYPIYREELLPIMLNSNWTNLHQYRIEGRAAVNKCWSVAAAYAYLRADYGELSNAGGGGCGDSFGQLVSAFIDYKPMPHLKFAVEIAEFFPNSYWDDGDNSVWARVQTIVDF